MNLTRHLRYNYNSLLHFTNNNEANIYCNLSNYLMVYIHLVKQRIINEDIWYFVSKLLIIKTNNYRTCQSLFDFLKLSLSPINKEPVRKSNRRTNVANYSVICIKTPIVVSAWNYSIYVKEVTKVLVKSDKNEMIRWIETFNSNNYNTNPQRELLLKHIWRTYDMGIKRIIILN